MLDDLFLAACCLKVGHTALITPWLALFARNTHTVLALLTGLAVPLSPVHTLLAFPAVPCAHALHHVTSAEGVKVRAVERAIYLKALIHEREVIRCYKR